MLLDNDRKCLPLVQISGAADPLLGKIAYHALWLHQSTRIEKYKRHELLSTLLCSKFFKLVRRVPLLNFGRSTK